MPARETPQASDERIVGYVSPALAEKAREHAARLDRSMSWIVGEALKLWVAAADSKGDS